MFGLKLYRVNGRSMAPILRDGQLILVRNVTAKTTLQVNDIIVLDHPQYGMMVKRIVKMTEQSIHIAGDGQSTSQADLGIVPLSAVQYKYVMKF